MPRIRLARRRARPGDAAVFSVPARVGSRASRRSRAVAAVASLLAVSTLATGCAVGVHASPSAGGYAAFQGPVGGDTVTLREQFESSPSATHEYWADPTKFENASPVGITAPDSGISPGAGDPATGQFVKPTDNRDFAASPNVYPPTPQAQTYDRAGLGASTFGRLYMQFADGESVCSATVINSPTRNVVITAAHCVYDTSNGNTPARSVIFVPGDRNNAQQQPYGVWAATTVSAPQQFRDHAASKPSGEATGPEGWAYDFAFLTIEEKNGQRIQDVTGGQGIAFGVPIDGLVQVGYPSAPPFKGTDEFMCASQVWKQSWSAGYTHQCDMTPGSSGGGWTTNYDTKAGSGYIVGVTSTGNDTTANGSVLGSTAQQLYQSIAQAG